MLTSSPRWVWLAGLALVLAGWAAYSNSFGGPFIFDDRAAIADNPTIQQGWLAALFPPLGATTVSGRPVVNLSLALNYQLGGLNVWGYHAVNLAIQLLAGLTLFGLARRTFERPVLRERYGAAALPLAFGIALLWTVHPLQTESVTYVIQRAESLMGLFYLLTLYCFIRGVESPRGWVWHAVAAVTCWLGMLTKESMATAPLMVLLYDRTFVAGTFAGAWRRHRKFYAALAGAWIPLAWLVVTVSWPGNAGVSNPALAGMGLGTKSYVYSLKQCEAIVHYLALSFWPHRLGFSAGNGVVTNPLDVAPQMLALALLLAATIYALWRRPALGFLGAWFFVILAPTSSVVPLNGQTMAEHHMYLSLAALVALAVLGLYATLGRGGYVAALALALGLGGLTVERNQDYRTEISIMHEIALQQNPTDPKIQNDLGSSLYELGRTREAMARFLEAVKLDPNFTQAEYDLGNAYFRNHQYEEARDAFAAAVRLNPHFARAHNNLGSLYMVNFHEPEKAISEFKAAILDDPTLYEADASLANLYTQTNRPEEAIPYYEQAIRLKPDFGEAHFGLGNALILTNRVSEAVPQYEIAVRLMPDNGSAHRNYATVLLQLKKYDDAIRQLEDAVRIDPNYPNVRDKLETARQLAQQSRNGTPAQ